MAEMHDSGESLYELKSGMQKYPQVLVNVRLTEMINPDDNMALQKSVRSVEEKLGDKGRVLLRASGTEPLIRVMVEGENAETVNNFAQQLAEDVKKAIGA
jgi:phosphoglucosamine mutase